MKKIGIDARLYSQTGVGTYLKNLLYYLEKKEFKNNLFYIYLITKDYDRISFKNKKIIKRKVSYQWHSIREQFGFAIKLYLDNLDLMHFTYFSYPILYLKKFIATVHDTTPLLFKTGKASTKNQLIYQIKHLFFRIILRCQIKRAIKIITPTSAVKKQLINIYGEKISKKIFPIYEGVNYQIIGLSKNRHSGESRQRRGDSRIVVKDNDSGQAGMTKKPFFIYVGNFYPHKNVEKLIQAFSKAQTSHKLILLGPNDYFKERLFQLINRLKQGKKIIFFNNPSISDLVFFYKNALALIHPSLSEGFGLPLIEAAYFNCPIIASNIAVFKELLGNNYLSFDPNDIDDIGNKIETFLEKKPIFNYENILKQYSFEKMTDQTLQIYKQALS